MSPTRQVKISRSEAGLSIQTPSDSSYLAHIREFIVDLARKIGFSEDDVAKVEMSVDEACSNVVEHAYAAGKQWHWQHRNPEIRLTIRIEDHRLVIEINDHGQKFDFGTYRPDKIHDRVGAMQTGGYGIAIMRQFMDEATYSSSAATGNTLRLVKHLKKT